MFTCAKGNLHNFRHTTRFSLTELLDEQESYNFLLKTLHPDGLKCKHGHPLPPDQQPHDRRRDPIVDYRCRICGNIFNLFTGTIWQGSHYDCRKIVLIMRGVVQGTPTRQLADELGVDYGTLLTRRHRIQQLALEHKPDTPLADEQTEGDEMFQNAGEKGRKHPDPADPPRRRANKRPGKGTLANDRPPVLGLVGRERGQIRLAVCADTTQDTIQPEVEHKTTPTTTLYTDESNAYHRVAETWMNCGKAIKQFPDESNAYHRVAETGRGHGTVCHSQRLSKNSLVHSAELV